MENDGHEQEQIYRSTDHRCSQATRCGMPVKELCRKDGFSDATFYKWRAKYGGMDASDAKRLKQLEGENAKLTKLLAEAHLDIHALKGVFWAKALSNPRKLSGSRLRNSYCHYCNCGTRISSAGAWRLCGNL